MGGAVAALLQAEGRRVVRATRNPAGAGEVRFDLLEPQTFAPALQGVTAVMLMSRPGDEDAGVHAAPFVRAMQASAVRHIVVLSALGAQARPAFALRKVELLVEQCGIAWTHVRPNFYMQLLAQPPIAAEVAGRGTLSLPLGDARIAYVDARDVAAVLHRTLAGAGPVGRAIEVNGPHALSHAQVAGSIARAIGSAVSYVPLHEAAARDLMLARGLGQAQVERVLAAYRLIRGGLCAEPDDAAARWLGRPLRTWEAFVHESAAAWRRI